MKSFLCLVGFAASSPTNDAYTSVVQVSKQLSHIRESAGLPPGDAVGRAIDTWQKHESYMRQRDTHPDILNKFVAIGKDLNLKGLIQGALSEEERIQSTNGLLDSNEKWTNYGCYCLPTQGYTNDGHWLGRGSPVDKIDHLCQKLYHCYQCTEKTYAKCPATQPYSYRTNETGQTACAKETESCQGALCGCDVDFSYELSQLSSTWSKKYSVKFGFDRAAKCGVGIKQPSGGSSDRNLANIEWEGMSPVSSGLKDPKCCGRGLHSIIYHPERLECCKDGSTKAIGSCGF